MEFEKCIKYPNPIALINKGDLNRIHLASLRILEETGIKFYDKKILKLFAAKGADVDFDKKIVKIEKNLIEHYIKKVPKYHSIYSQNLNELKIGSGNLYLESTMENLYIIDSNTLTRRTAILEDVKNAVRMIDELPYYHICGSPFIPQDICPELANIYGAIEIFRNTNKHCRVPATNSFEAKSIIELASIIAGNKEKLYSKPFISTVICPSSPLCFPKNTCEVLWEFAKLKLQIILAPAPVAGALSPNTICGTIALANAESLAGITLIQMINEGSPIVYGGACTNFDMRTGNCAYGTSEFSLLSTITAQLAKFYNLPSYGVVTTNANIMDVQAGYEKMHSTLLAYLAGHDIIGDLSFNGNLLTSIDSILIQHEIIKRVTDISRNIIINDEMLALDVIKEVGPGGNFLSEPHTLRYLKGDFKYTNIGNFETYENWVSKGGIDTKNIAKKVAEEIIINSVHKSLSDEQNYKITKLLEKLKKEL
ncbi:MAG: trimethylamine methyltransferase family protein [Cyanobacteria bacterium]|nr:trimethylamine methyltransferase family protein [Cyanobacteriota bacterium]